MARDIRTMFLDTPTEQVNPDLLASALIAAWKKRWAAITVYNAASKLRGFFGWLDRFLGRLHFSGHVPTLDQPDPRSTMLTTEQAHRVVNEAAPWFRCVMLSCYELGLRSGTAARLAPKHWNPERHTITITTKKNHTITLPVSPRLEELFLAAETDPETPFWLAHRGEVRLRPNRTLKANVRVIRAEWERHKKRLGLPTNLWMHDLRRSLCVHVYENTSGDLVASQAALAHRHLATTLRYLAPLVKDTARLRTTLSQIWIPKGRPTQ